MMENNQIIIGVYGRMRSGKSIFSEAMPAAWMSVSKTMIHTHYCSMSSIMKQHVESLTGLKRGEQISMRASYATLDSYLDYSAEDKAKTVLNGKTIGVVLQEYGFLMKQLIGDTVWIDMTIKGIPTEAQLVVVDGLRYKSDADGIRNAGGFVVEIVRDNAKSADGRDNSHISETDLNNYQFDATIKNDEVRGTEFPPMSIRDRAILDMKFKIIKLIQSGTFSRTK